MIFSSSTLHLDWYCYWINILFIHIFLRFHGFCFLLMHRRPCLAGDISFFGFSQSPSRYSLSLGCRDYVANVLVGAGIPGSVVLWSLVDFCRSLNMLRNTLHLWMVRATMICRYNNKYSKFSETSYWLRRMAVGFFSLEPRTHQPQVVG